MHRARLLLNAIVSTLAFATVFAVPAYADTITVIGNTNGSLATATSTFSFNAQTNTFTFTLNNTSPFEAIITGIGYDLPPTGNAVDTGLNGFTGNVTFQPAGVDFDFSDGALGNVPQFDSAVLDFGFLTGASFTGGNPPDGLPPGILPGDEATFVVSGALFAGLTEEQIGNAIYLRFQQVGSTGALSDVGTVTVPDPASTFSLSLLAFGALAAFRRRQGKHR